jgi:hypothetical protein
MFMLFLLTMIMKMIIMIMSAALMTVGINIYCCRLKRAKGAGVEMPSDARLYFFSGAHPVSCSTGTEAFSGG